MAENTEQNDKLERAPHVPPFVQFVCSSIPQVFDDSLSYYEALSALWAFIEKEVIKVINNNATVTESYIALTNEYIEKFNELKEYVDTYFDNLDVQQEINNKLDDMAEQGTLQEIITAYIQANVAWCFDTVADMKLAENLIAGSYAQTLGFHTKGDGGGSIYYISDTGTADEIGVIAVDTLFAHLVPQGSGLKQLGAESGDDLSDYITYLNTNYGLSKFELDLDGSISMTITSDDNFEIDGNNHTIDVSSSDADTTVFDVYGTLKLYNTKFDGNSTGSCLAVRAHDLAKIDVKGCEFSNFYEDDNTLITRVITIHTGVIANLDDLYFHDIKALGNGTIGDAGGSASCIAGMSDLDESSTNPTLVNISNITFENNYNVDGNGDYLIEDFDNIKLQNHITNNDKHQFNISNITSYNSGKRVIKIQTDNVNVNGVTCYADSDHEMLNIIGVFYSNHQISNIIGKVYKLQSPIEMLESSHVHVSNVKVTTTTFNVDAYSSASIKIVKCNWCNFENVTCEGCAYGLSIYDTCNYLKFSNCRLQSNTKQIYIYTRTTASATPTGININNIRFENCDFACSANTNQRVTDIANPSGSGNTIDNLHFVNCFFEISKSTYLYGTFHDESVHSIYEGCLFRIVNTGSIVAFNKPSGNCKMVNTRFIHTTTDPKINIGASARFYSLFLDTGGGISITNGGKAILLYPRYSSISGNTSSNTELTTFDMS